MFTTRERVLAKLARNVGEDISIDISFVDSIDRTAVGKFRPVLSLRQRSQLDSVLNSVKDR